MEEIEAVLETGAAAAVEVAASALAKRGETTPLCSNCSNPLIGPFCAVCGQPLNTHRRSVRHLAHEFVKDIVSFDSRILRTGRALLFKPGELPKAFREGRTIPYVPAVRLYLFVSLLFFLFLSATGLAFLQLGLQVQSVVYSHDQAGQVYITTNGKTKLVEGLKSDAKGNMSESDPVAAVPVPDEKADGQTASNAFTGKLLFFQRPGLARNKVTPEVAKALAKLREEAASEGKPDKDGNWILRGIATTLSKLEADPAALNGPLTAWIPRILFVLLPLFALLLTLFYRGLRKEFLFVDHLIFSLTMHSFAFVLLIFAAILAQVLSGGWVAFVTWVVLSVYFFLSLKRFYGQSWFRTGFKFAAVSLVYFLFFLCPALVFAIVASVVSG